MVKHRRLERSEGPRPMRDRVFLRRLHLAERPRIAVRHEHRIIAEAVAATRRQNEMTEDFPFKNLRVAAGPREAKIPK